MKKSKYMKGGGKSSKYKAAGGMKTEVGKEAKVQTYNEYVKKMFGGGATSQPGVKKKRTKGMARGGNLNISKRVLDKMTPRQLASDTMSEYFTSKVNESKGRKRGPGMAAGGPTQPSRVSKKGKSFKKPTVVEGKPMRITRKTPQESKVRKKPGMARGGNLNINKRTLAKMTPKQLKSKTMTDYFNSKVSESRKGRKKRPGR